MLDVDGKLDTSGVEAIVAALLERVNDTGGFWDDLGDWWAKRQSDWFAGGDIPVNAPATARRKGNNRGLVDTGALRQSTIAGQPFNRRQASATFGLRKGSPSYAKAVLGLSEPRGAPKRAAVAPLGVVDVAQVRDILADYITDVVNGAL